MTLTRFLTNYVYIPIGGNRRGKGRQMTNMMVTMLASGLWHGAGWTFVLWGGMHGIFLVIHRLWQDRPGFLRPNATIVRIAGPASSRLLTFAVVVIGWVLFRAESFTAAAHVYKGMLGLNGVSVPPSFASLPGPLPSLLSDAGVTFEGFAGLGKAWVMGEIGLLVLAVWFLPSVPAIMARYAPVLGSARLWTARRRWQWRMNARWAGAVGAIAALALLSMNRVTEFLYFQF